MTDMTAQPTPAVETAPRAARRLPLIPLVIALVALFAVVAAGVILGTRAATPPSITILLSSDPYPLTVGNGRVLVRLHDESGQPIEDASVHVTARAEHPGALPLAAHATGGAAGEYRLPFTFQMPEKWTLDVEITRADRVARERYGVFVFPVPPQNRNPQAVYRSQSELARLAETPGEYWIVIPPGTAKQIGEGHGDDIIPEEIRLSLSGRRTLVIQNDDLTTHAVGPFVVRAGETVRQEFRHEAEYVGECTIRHGDEITIVVEA